MNALYFVFTCFLSYLFYDLLLYQIYNISDRFVSRDDEIMNDEMKILEFTRYAKHM